jgi:hypothetical protein
LHIKFHGVLKFIFVKLYAALLQKFTRLVSAAALLSLKVNTFLVVGIQWNDAINRAILWVPFRIYNFRSSSERQVVLVFSWIYAVQINAEIVHGWTALVGLSLIVEFSRSCSDTPHSVGLFWKSDQPLAETST